MRICLFWLKGDLKLYSLFIGNHWDLHLFIIGCDFISWDHAAEKVSYLKQLLDNCAGMGKEILITENNFPESIRKN